MLSEAPALAIGGIDVGVGGLMVRKPRLLAVPPERLAGEANGNGPEQRDLGQPAAVIEVGPGLAPSADRLDPVPVVVLDPRERFGQGILL